MAVSIEQQPEVQDNLYSSFFRAALKFGGRVAFKADGGRGKSYSYTECLDIVSKFGAGLVEECPDEPEIGLLSENRPEWPIAYLAILAASKTVVPIDANLKPEEMSYIIGHARLKTIIVSDKLEESLAPLSANLRLISFSKKAPNNWSGLFRIGTRHIAINPSSPAALIYTSGTTGQPKAVILTHANLLHNLNSIKQALCFGEHDIFLSVLPLHHTFEATCGFLTPINCGAQIVYARSLKSKEILEDIARNNATVLCGVPLLFEKMYDAINRKIMAASVGRRNLFKFLFNLSSLGWQIKLKLGRRLFSSMRHKAHLGSIRLFVSGGAPLPKVIARFFNLLGFTFLEGYGMTECSPVISASRPDNIKFGSVGPVLPGTEVAIDKPDKHGIGEIIVRGANVTPGYKDNPEQTQQLIRDGWLYTGDLGKLRGGHLWITGRAKNLIVSAAGKNIYPEEIEEKLFASPYILEAVVVGRKKVASATRSRQEGKQGEEVRAVIVPDLEQIAAEFHLSPTHPDMNKLDKVIKQVVGEINTSMAAYKRITSFDIQLDELDKTSTKKVKRFVYG